MKKIDFISLTFLVIAVVTMPFGLIYSDAKLHSYSGYILLLLGTGLYAYSLKDDLNK